MSRPLDFPHTSGFTFNIVTGGHIKRPDPGQCNKLQSTDPLRHGNNIDSIQYPFISIVSGCTQEDLETNAPPPEPGATIVTVPGMGGPSERIALGTIKDLNKSGSSAGNFDLMQMRNVTTAVREDVQKVLSKGYQTASRNGAEVRKPKDGEHWRHELTKGIPSHAAMYPLAGTVLPNRQKIETAIQQFGNILSPSMASMMPGSFMNMGDLFSGLTNKQKRQIQEKMPQDVYQAFESTSNLMMSGEGGAYFTSGRVNPEVYVANAIDLLSQVTNVHDLHDTLMRLQYDTDLFGLDELPPTEIETEGAFGTYKQKIDANGNITNEIPDVIQKLIEAFSGMLSNPNLASGAGAGENLFGEASKTMTDMLGRVEPSVQKFRQSMLQELSQSPAALVMNQVLDKGARQGGNPLELILG